MCAYACMRIAASIRATRTECTTPATTSLALTRPNYPTSSGQGTQQPDAEERKLVAALPPSLNHRNNLPRRRNLPGAAAQAPEQAPES